MMAAPFAGRGTLRSLSFSLRYTVGIHARPAQNVSCVAGVELGGGSIHTANFSSVAEAVAWCKAAPRCGGFSAQKAVCSAGSSKPLQAFDFKDGWGVTHRSVRRGWSSWIVPPPPPATAEGVMIRLAWHRELECPTAAAASAAGAGKTVSWLWESPRFLPCESPAGCSERVNNVSVSGLDLGMTQAAPSALALHFENGDHDLTVQLPVNITLGWAD